MIERILPKPIQNILGVLSMFIFGIAILVLGVFTFLNGQCCGIIFILMGIALSLAVLEPFKDEIRARKNKYSKITKEVAFIEKKEEFKKIEKEKNTGILGFLNTFIGEIIVKLYEKKLGNSENLIILIFEKSYMPTNRRILEEIEIIQRENYNIYIFSINHLILGVSIVDKNN